ncbi:Dabb family protein [Neolewinella lacunae]|uniref:Dabb family protein n=1 Tax=Neolewinella lacunae TaxID=1517758 RepID=A0A923TBQ4_9BACT|nr:Dabb family protein [Neolewinella lacunae]MBC6992862.1 Dabb family protein [Neolewinella lacunae]MDN3633774.1 Dabb family protein [Neolewinella lacunae]
MRTLFTGLLFCCTLAFFTNCNGEKVVEETIIEKEVDAAAEPGLIHTVYFWLKDSVDAAGAQEFVDGVWQLEEISSVKRMFVGPAASTPTRGVTDNSFDYALILWFDDVAGHDQYQVDPIHLKFVAEQEAKFKRVQVYDNVLGK